MKKSILKKAHKDPEFRKQLIARLQKTANNRAIAKNLKQSNLFSWEGYWGTNPAYIDIEDDREWEARQRKNPDYYVLHMKKPVSRGLNLNSIYFHDKKGLLEGLKHIHKNLTNAIKRVNREISID